MATKVEAKTYFPGSMMDLNNGMWNLYHDDIAIGSEKSQCYDPFLMKQTMDGYAKEQMRQTILNQESIFRHQLQELHRLYKRQKDLMNELKMKEHYNFTMPAEAPQSNHFLSQFHSQISKEMHIPISNGRLVDFGSLNSKCSTSQRRVIDLELPADVEDDNEEKQVGSVDNLSKQRAHSLADLNEPIQVEEKSSAASFTNKNSDYCVSGINKCYNNGYGNGIFSHQSNWLQTESKKAIDLEQLSRKRKLFGVELCESSSHSSQSSSRDHKNHNHNHHHWLGSSDSSRQISDDFVGNKIANNSNSRLMNGGGINFKNSVSEILEEPREKDNTLPPWLMSKGKDTTLYQMNLDSLQHNSQQFFKKSETTKGVHGSKSQIDNHQGVTKILGVPIVDNFKESVGQKNCISEKRHHIDLNLSFDEEEEEEEEAPSSTPYIPETVVKIASMEIDLEAPATLESETEIRVDTPSELPLNDELDKAAAEAIMAISSSEPPAPHEPPADTLLQWFAEVIASGDCVEKDSSNVNKNNNNNNNKDSIREGMDYFEYMTLNLQETKEEYHCYKPMIMEEKEEEGLLRKRTTRKGQGKRGRQKKDFQRDVLPGIVSLSRREVTEDIQTFEQAFAGIGVSWQSSLSRRKAAGKNGRGRRRLVVSTSSSHTPPSPPPAAAGGEQSVCREVALEEKSLSGWGKRTRRLPRQRCQNGSNHHSLALKC